MRYVLRIAAVLLATLVPTSLPADPVDAPFAHYNAATPGCALGVDEAGKPTLTRAYGMSDLEHAVPITPDTIFEAGSVSKQFTAAAVLTLVHDGKLAVSDDIRKYLPEMPDYGTPITIDELLNHTSGLRDWGAVEDLAGWPRTARIYTLADVLQITSRQRALNYKPGTAWSYTNTGYNLLAIIVERVSGKSLAQFTHDRLFVPLGMTHTQWRDDFRRIVPNRAIAYERGRTTFEQLMPFENAYGNGGLLTTVGDLLIWNRALSEGRIGPAVVADMERPSVLANGRTLGYGRGLFLDPYDGARLIAHPGATAGYTAWLGRYPDKGLSMAILCNRADAATTRIARALTDVYLHAPAAKAADAAPAPHELEGWYADDRAGAPLHIVAKRAALVTDDGQSVTLAPDGGIRIGIKHFTRGTDGSLVTDEEGDVITFARADGYAPSRDDLAAIVGRYHSDEVDATYNATLEKDGIHLTLADRPEATTLLKPAYRDAFVGENFIVRLVRGADGHIMALRLSDDRAWDVRFDRIP